MYVCMYVCMYHIIHKPLYPHAPWMIYIYIYTYLSWSFWSHCGSSFFLGAWLGPSPSNYTCDMLPALLSARSHCVCIYSLDAGTSCSQTQSCIQAVACRPEAKVSLWACWRAASCTHIAILVWAVTGNHMVGLRSALSVRTTTLRSAAEKMPLANWIPSPSWSGHPSSGRRPAVSAKGEHWQEYGTYHKLVSKLVRYLGCWTKRIYWICLYGWVGGRGAIQSIATTEVYSRACSIQNSISNPQIQARADWLWLGFSWLLDATYMAGGASASSTMPGWGRPLPHPLCQHTHQLFIVNLSGWRRPMPHPQCHDYDCIQFWL